MSAPVIQPNSQPNSPRRRSARLEKAVALEIAGKGPDGRIFVESTSTRNISEFGASLATRNAFQAGAPIAVRRSGAKPARACVVSVQPGDEPGVQQIGVKFVGDEAYWDCEFPGDWEEPERRPPQREVPAADPERTLRVAGAVGSAESDANAEKLGETLDAARRRIAALDASLEAVVRKAETVRAQAESVLEECTAQVESARRQGAAALAGQLDSLTARKNSLDAEFAERTGAAAEATRLHLELARAATTQETAGLKQRLDSLRRDLDSALQAGQAEYQQFLADAGQRSAGLVEQLATRLEDSRQAAAALDAQSATWREQMASALGGLRQEVEQLLQSARGEIGATGQAGIRDFRQQLPGLGQEASKFLAAALAEQKSAAAQWMAQSLESARAVLADMENSRRAALAEHARQAVEQHTTALQARVEEVRAGGDAVAAALEARLQRARNALHEVVTWSEQALAKARGEVSAAVTHAETQVREAAAGRVGDLDETAARHLARLRQQDEELQSGAVEAARRLDQNARELQEMGVRLDRSARQKREELEALFVSLIERYERRKEALDRLLEILENGRAGLRADLESLRTLTEQSQARLSRFTAEREAALKSRSRELEQKIEESATAMQSALEKRAVASLGAVEEKFQDGLEEIAARARLKFQGTLESSLETGAARLAEMKLALDRRAEEHKGALDSAASAHALRFEQARRELEERTAAAIETLVRQTVSGQEALQQAAQAAAGSVEEQQVRAAAASAEALAAVQQARAALARDNAEVEKQARQRQQTMEAQFAALAADLEKKRAALDAFSAGAEQTKAEISRSFAALDRRQEEARSALHVAQRDAQAEMEKRASVLAEQMAGQLKQSLHALEQELDAIGEAAQGVYQARLRVLSDQAVTAAGKLMEQGADACAASLDRAMQNTRQEHERHIEQLAQRGEAAVREEQRARDEAVAVASAALSEQMQQIGRGAVERVREAHEMLLREIPARVTEAELAFRESLEKILEQSRREAAQNARFKTAGNGG